MKNSQAGSNAGPASLGSFSARLTGLVHALLGLAILTGFLLVGSSLHRVGVPIPGGVLGLILFYLSLSLGLVKMSWVESAAAFLLRHMLLLFIPVTVGLMDLAPTLKHEALPLTASLVVSLVAVQIVTGLLAKTVLGRPDDGQ